MTIGGSSWAPSLSSIARTRTVTGNKAATPKRQSVGLSNVAPATVASAQNSGTMRSAVSSGVAHVEEGEAAPLSTADNETKLPKQQPATLLDIFAQQQQLRQYSNQRAQLTPTQIQSLYMGRNARGSTGVSSASANGTESTAVSDQVTVLFESESFSIQDTSAGASGGDEKASASSMEPAEQMSFAEMVSSLPPPATV